jgi:hypothetical protein
MALDELVKGGLRDKMEEQRAFTGLKVSILL